MPNPVVHSEHVSLLLESKDETLINLAESFIGEPLPKEEELVEMLVFFQIFAMGFREMGLNEIADTYHKRISLFIATLSRLGLTTQKRKEYVRNILIPGPLSRIINRASLRAAYVMVDLKREIPIPIERKKKK